VKSLIVHGYTKGGVAIVKRSIHKTNVMYVSNIKIVREV